MVIACVLAAYRPRIGCRRPRRRILLRPTGAPRWMSWFAGVARPRSRPRPCPNWISATHSGFMARVSEAHLSAFHELVRILNPCRRDCNPPDVLRLTITARHLPNHGFFCAVWGFSCPFWCPFCRVSACPFLGCAGLLSPFLLPLELPGLVFRSDPFFVLSVTLYTENRWVLSGRHRKKKEMV
jgi:hypothetical protein